MSIVGISTMQTVGSTENLLKKLKDKNKSSRKEEVIKNYQYYIGILSHVNLKHVYDSNYKLILLILEAVVENGLNVEVIIIDHILVWLNLKYILDKNDKIKIKNVNKILQLIDKHERAHFNASNLFNMLFNSIPFLIEAFYEAKMYCVKKKEDFTLQTDAGGDTYNGDGNDESSDDNSGDDNNRGYYNKGDYEGESRQSNYPTDCFFPGKRSGSCRPVHDNVELNKKRKMENNTFQLTTSAYQSRNLRKIHNYATYVNSTFSLYLKSVQTVENDMKVYALYNNIFALYCYTGDYLQYLMKLSVVEIEEGPNGNLASLKKNLQNLKRYIKKFVILNTEKIYKSYFKEIYNSYTKNNCTLKMNYNFFNFSEKNKILEIIYIIINRISNENPCFQYDVKKEQIKSSFFIPTSKKEQLLYFFKNDYELNSRYRFVNIAKIKGSIKILSVLIKNFLKRYKSYYATYVEKFFFLFLLIPHFELTIYKNAVKKEYSRLFNCDICIKNSNSGKKTKGEKIPLRKNCAEGVSPIEETDMIAQLTTHEMNGITSGSSNFPLYNDCNGKIELHRKLLNKEHHGSFTRPKWSILNACYFFDEKLNLNSNEEVFNNTNIRNAIMESKTKYREEDNTTFDDNCKYVKMYIKGKPHLQIYSGKYPIFSTFENSVKKKLLSQSYFSNEEKQNNNNDGEQGAHLLYLRLHKKKTLDIPLNYLLKIDKEEVKPQISLFISLLQNTFQSIELSYDHNIKSKCPNIFFDNLQLILKTLLLYIHFAELRFLDKSTLLVYLTQILNVMRKNSLSNYSCSIKSEICEHIANFLIYNYPFLMRIFGDDKDIEDIYVEFIKILFIDISILKNEKKYIFFFDFFHIIQEKKRLHDIFCDLFILYYILLLKEMNKEISDQIALSGEEQENSIQEEGHNSVISHIMTLIKKNEHLLFNDNWYEIFNINKKITIKKIYYYEIYCNEGNNYENRIMDIFLKGQNTLYRKKENYSYVEEKNNKNNDMHILSRIFLFFKNLNTFEANLYTLLCKIFEKDQNYNIYYEYILINILLCFIKNLHTINIKKTKNNITFHTFIKFSIFIIKKEKRYIKRNMYQCRNNILVLKLFFHIFILFFKINKSKTFFPCAHGEKAVEAVESVESVEAVEAVDAVDAVEGANVADGAGEGGSKKARSSPLGKNLQGSKRRYFRFYRRKGQNNENRNMENLIKCFIFFIEYFIWTYDILMREEDVSVSDEEIEKFISGKRGQNSNEPSYKGGGDAGTADACTRVCDIDKSLVRLVSFVRKLLQGSNATDDDVVKINAFFLQLVEYIYVSFLIGPNIFSYCTNSIIIKIVQAFQTFNVPHLFCSVNDQYRIFLCSIYILNIFRVKGDTTIENQEGAAGEEGADGHDDGLGNTKREEVEVEEKAQDEEEDEEEEEAEEKEEDEAEEKEEDEAEEEEEDDEEGDEDDDEAAAEEEEIEARAEEDAGRKKNMAWGKKSAMHVSKLIKEDSLIIFFKLFLSINFNNSVYIFEGEKTKGMYIIMYDFLFAYNKILAECNQRKSVYVCLKYKSMITYISRSVIYKEEDISNTLIYIDAEIKKAYTGKQEIKNFLFATNIHIITLIYLISNNRTFSLHEIDIKQELNSVQLFINIYFYLIKHIYLLLDKQNYSIILALVCNYCNLLVRAMDKLKKQILKTNDSEEKTQEKLYITHFYVLDNSDLFEKNKFYLYLLSHQLFSIVHEFFKIRKNEFVRCSQYTIAKVTQKSGYAIGFFCSYMDSVLYFDSRINKMFLQNAKKFLNLLNSIKSSINLSQIAFPILIKLVDIYAAFLKKNSLDDDIYEEKKMLKRVFQISLLLFENKTIQLCYSTMNEKMKEIFNFMSN
ncbi:conserved Plasmodium membrane protein, unknown function [Plasmodium ovale wallikeri]|uniref:Uncharacterized protein n=1 Tax=Plasmodium ovale wallikeri TaxID=864142 RepID=A0A1A8YQS1_PLAOA|nr:conserved Plasmodium membrane protein, unknown function [Plasmodium ovale wallikeri]SBT33973.1 conserved Plasmodium membrane protein, unknown function [Plasmodium ovale wallikeri]